ncbi:Protein of unknown function DUF55 [hydrothermal vent metagenome]|uniref:EVE domain-containing protein n=1 Tax=hydrothermal vent metagenome TaxID=652676 RepID=A0A3B1BT61_9ZZZZ
MVAFQAAALEAERTKKMSYWLFKTEPDVYSIDDLKKEKMRITSWEGVRNYQARNFMRDDMKRGDLGFFYHSNCPQPGIVGVVKVVKNGYPDHTSWDSKSRYFDTKSTKENPRWFMVDVKYLRVFKKPILLAELKENPKIKDFALVKKGSRLSVMPVPSKAWELILKME